MWQIHDHLGFVLGCFSGAFRLVYALEAKFQVGMMLFILQPIHVCTPFGLKVGYSLSILSS